MMKDFILKTALLCTFCTLFSCEKEKPKTSSEPSIAGVVLSFDDTYVDEWYATDQELKQYEWKATFCISKINTLNHSEIKKLLELQKKGHEIAGHGFHHYHAEKFFRKHGIYEYLKQEISPMRDLMNFYGIKATSFVYPYGGRNKILDVALLNKFKIIRGRSFCEEKLSKQSSFYNKSRLVFSFSIDETHNHFNTSYLLKLLDYAKKNNKILILNSHKTVKNISGDYQTKEATLKLICNYIKRNNMHFYTLSDLDKI